MVRWLLPRHPQGGSRGAGSRPQVGQTARPTCNKPRAINLVRIGVESSQYPSSGSHSLVAKHFPVGVRIRNEYPNVAARRRFLLRVFKTRPGVGIAFRGTPATASTPPDPAHDRRSALRINSRTPPKATSTGPSSPGAVALGPYGRLVPRSALKMAWLASIEANAVRSKC